MYNGTEACPPSITREEETYVGVFSSMGSVILGILGTLLATNREAIATKIQNIFSSKPKKDTPEKRNTPIEDAELTVTIGDVPVKIAMRSRSNSTEVSRDSAGSSMETESPREEDNYRKKETEKKKKKQHRRHKSR